MRRAFLVVIAVAILCSPGWSQNEQDVGGLVVGGFGSGGTIGSGGVFLGVYDTGSFHKITRPGIFAELGVAGPTPKSPVDGVFSFDYQSTYNLRQDLDRASRRPALLFLSGGYSRFFATGNGVNYGGGLLWRFPREHSEFSAIRVEYRESYVPGWGRQPGVRIGFESGLEEF